MRDAIGHRRVVHRVTYPARFMLIAAMNPCRCGHAYEPGFSCKRGRIERCTSDYQARISGPLMDRIDLRIEVPAVTAADLILPPPAEGSVEVAARVAAARDVQTARYAAIGFLLTEESVSIPFNALGFISIRASIKFSGLVNISGFHVDPGYSGKLLFSVFNAGPSRIHLKRGAKIFPIWLADLHEDISKKKIKQGYDDLPSKNINQISGKFTTAYQVEKHLEELKEEISALKAFKTLALIVLTIAGALLIPTFKEAVTKIFRDPYAAASRFGTVANGFCSHSRQWLWVPACAGTTLRPPVNPAVTSFVYTLPTISPPNRKGWSNE
jgi:Magnesium chelatase, subunit ChlI